MHTAEIILAVVVVAIAVATLARRVRLPAPPLLVVAGLAVGLIPGVPDVGVGPDVVGLVVLPPLLYAAARELVWAELRRVWRPVAVLAVGLVAASATAVAGVATAMGALATPAFVLGAVLASTDPIAVNALGRNLALPARVRALVQAESLFNDATSLVLFQVAVGVAVTGGAVRWGPAIGDFFLLAAAGGAVGAAVAAVVVVLRRRVSDPALRIVVALVTPYLAYVLALAGHGSGVTAVVVAGVIVGHRRGDLLPADRAPTEAVYATVTFVLESVVFGLIGLEVPTLVRELPGSQYPWPLTALALAGTLLVVRAAWVFPLAGRHPDRPEGRRAFLAVPAVVSWAGTRGVVPLAAALSIPVTLRSGVPFPQRPLLLLLATVVIAVTVVVQGFTLEPLVRRLGFGAAPG